MFVDRSRAPWILRSAVLDRNVWSFFCRVESVDFVSLLIVLRLQTENDLMGADVNPMGDSEAAFPSSRIIVKGRAIPEPPVLRDDRFPSRAAVH